MNVICKAAAALMIVVISLAGCKKDPESAETDKPANTMTMTTAISGGYLILAGTGKAVIDWGDGSAPDTVTLSTPDETGYLTYYPHTFPDKTSRTIVIKGQNITYLDCSSMELTALDVSKNPALTELACTRNRLTSLDVTKNTALEYLNCFYNRLTSLDVTKNSALTELQCSRNQLTSLDVTKNMVLTELVFDENRLTGLDVTKNTALTGLRCQSNNFDTAGLDVLFSTLHANAGSKTIHIFGNPGTSGCHSSIAEDKGWGVVYIGMIEAASEKRIVSATDFKYASFNLMNFDGKWLQLVGKSSVPFKMMIRGTGDSGKSTLAIEFARYLFGRLNKRVLYVANEEGAGAILHEKMTRLNAFHPNLFIARTLPPRLVEYDFFVLRFSEFHANGLAPI